MMHSKPHPLAGQMVELTGDATKYIPVPFIIEDWWDRVSHTSWMSAVGFNPAVSDYSLRQISADEPAPLDDEVVYGRDATGFGRVIHVSEIGSPF